MSDTASIASAARGAGADVDVSLGDCHTRDMHILVRAFITGFGLRLGAEAAKAVVKRLEGRRGSNLAPSPADAEEEDEGAGHTDPDPPSV